jgi:hypothetical protein
MFATILTIAAITLSPFHNNHQHQHVTHPFKWVNKTNVHKYRYHKTHKTLSPMDIVAKSHHWNDTEVYDAWVILYMESSSTPSDVNINAYNSQSGCAGSAQFASWKQYYAYGGSPKTVLGQLIGFGNYVTERYKSPSRALAFHYAHGWY